MSVVPGTVPAQASGGGGGGEAPAAAGSPTLSPQEYADSFLLDLTIADMLDERSQQSADRELGISDLGCHEYVRRFLDGQPFTDSPDTTAARIGKWLHAGALAARKTAQPHLLHEQTIYVELPNGLRIKGHADELDPDEPSVTDFKTVDGLAGVEKSGANSQQRFQRHLYGWGAWQMGLFGDIDPAQVIVRNIWMDRSANDKHLHVEQEPLGPEVLSQAVEWLYEVDEARQENRPARRDKEWSWCRQFCAFFTACRGTEPPPTDLRDPELVDAADLYLEGLELTRQGDRLKKAAASVLGEVTGCTGKAIITRTFIEPTDTRRGYYRRDVRKVE